jgi:hypothetical protein
VLGAIASAQNRSGTLVTDIVVSVLMLYTRPSLKKDMDIPSVTDRANTESVFLNPSVNAACFPGAFSELLEQSLTSKEWINSLTVLPTVEEMEESTDVGHELVAEVMEKSPHIIVSFSVTPALMKPRCANVVSKILVSHQDAKNLASRFAAEESTSEGGGYPNKLEDLVSEEWAKTEGEEQATFAPTAFQWNSLLGHVSALKEDLEKALEAISVLSQISDHPFEAVDDQVVHLRRSMGSRPHVAGSNLPALDIWTNMANIADEVNDAKTREPPTRPTHYEVATRSLADASNKALQKHAALINNLSNSKAEYMGQVRPMEAALDHVVKDLYEPEGSYNKVLMVGVLTGNGNDASLNLQTKIEALAGQVNGLTGSTLGGVSGSLNYPEFFALKSEVAQL